jgi:hypothetical protein
VRVRQLGRMALYAGQIMHLVRAYPNCIQIACTKTCQHSTMCASGGSSVCVLTHTHHCNTVCVCGPPITACPPTARCVFGANMFAQHVLINDCTHSLSRCALMSAYPTLVCTRLTTTTIGGGVSSRARAPQQGPGTKRERCC